LKNDIPIGTCSIIKKKKVYFFNYLIKKSFRGKGFSKIMLKNFTNKIKHIKVGHKVYANVVKRNRISYKLLLNNGFKLNSVKKKYYNLILKNEKKKKIKFLS